MGFSGLKMVFGRGYGFLKLTGPFFMGLPPESLYWKA